MGLLKNFTSAVLPHAALGAALSAKSYFRARATLPGYLTQIEEDFPDFHFQEAKLVDSGLENVVVILDEEWIFRFPRSDARRLAFAHELQLLMVLRQRTDIGLPDYRYVASGARFGGYPMLTGEPLNPKRFRALDPAGQRRALNQFVDFLSALHGLSPAKVQGGVRPRHISAKGEFAAAYFERQRGPLAHKLGRTLMRRIDRFYAAYAEPQPHPERMVHGDIDDHHVLLDERTGKLGIIDFGDAALGDPAADLAFLFSLPQWATQHALARYAFGADDPGLPERAKSHSVRFAVSRLSNCLQHVGYPRIFADTAAALETQLELLTV